MLKGEFITSLEEAEPSGPDPKKPRSEENRRMQAVIDRKPDSMAELMRYFLEQTREAMVDAYLDGVIVGYKCRNHGADIPEDLMEQLREEAKAVWYKPLNPEDEAILEILLAICLVDP